MRAREALAAALLLFCIGVGDAAETEPNYCNDSASEAQWQELLAKNPADYDLQALHALRSGLCQKVDRGVLTVPEATKVFERARGLP